MLVGSFGGCLYTLVYLGYRCLELLSYESYEDSRVTDGVL